MRGRQVDANWCDDCEVAVPPARGICPRCGRMVGVPRPVGRSESVERAAPAEARADGSASTALRAVSLEVLEPIDVVAAVAVLVVATAAVAVIVAGM